MAELIASPSELVPARGLPPAMRGPAGLADRLRAFLAQPAVARALPLLGVVAALGLAAMLWIALHQAPQRTLFAGLADADKQAVAEALGTAGIPYSLDGGSGALSVDESRFYQAKMLLAAQGLPKAAPSGDDMLAALPMGASRALEGERLRSAREMDLARTVEAIDAVEQARVHLAVEQPSVFVRDEARAAASVMLKLRGQRTLSQAQVQAIVHLVASSVPGLSPDGVSVVDQSGRLLSQASDDPATQASDRQVALQGRIEDRYRQALTTLLTPIVGDGNFTAEVHADLDFAEVAATRESFPKDTAVVRTEQGNWTNQDGGRNGQPVGVPGTLANQAPAAAQASATPAGAAPGPVVPGTAPGQASAAVTAKTEESYNRTFDIGREVSVTKSATGTVRRLSVAVALKNPTGAKPRPAAETAAIEALVKGAVGFDQARGDVVAVSSRTFAPAAGDTSPWYEASWLPMVLRNVAAVLAAGFVVFGIARPMMKRRAVAVAAAKVAADERRALIGGEMAQAVSDHATTDPERQVTLTMIERAPSYAARAQLIRTFVKQDPDRAALVVRDLIRADMPDAA